MLDCPFVTTMIVVRNEEKYIECCLRSLMLQNYPKDRYEILVIDGCSDDKTLEIVHRMIEDDNTSGVSIRIIKNEKLILAAGWNIGIQNALGEYVVRIDAHGYADKDFVRKSVNTILRVPDAVCVGGTLETKSLSPQGQIVADVLSSPFGIGNSKFRYSQKAEYVDTVAFGLYRKKIFDDVGYFDETLRRNQDNDMHRRIRETGGKFYLNPEIKSFYFARDFVAGMIKQGFYNGYWNIITFSKSKNSLSIRHLVPLAFVCGIICCLLVGIFVPFFFKILVMVLSVYLVLGGYFAERKNDKVCNVFFMPLMFLCLHVSYGMGSLLSIINLPLNQKRKEQ